MTYEEFTTTNEIKTGDRVIHKTLNTGRLLRISGDGTIGTFKFLGRDISFRLTAPDLDWCARPEKKSAPPEQEWTPRTREFLKECYEYITEKQPVFEPFGRDGKNLQAKWREEKGYAEIDPVMSTLSSWGYLLVGAGYAVKDSDGFWRATNKVWSEL